MTQDRGLFPPLGVDPPSVTWFESMKSGTSYTRGDVATCLNFFSFWDWASGYQIPRSSFLLFVPWVIGTMVTEALAGLV